VPAAAAGGRPAGRSRQAGQLRRDLSPAPGHDATRQYLGGLTTGVLDRGRVATDTDSTDLKHQGPSPAALLLRDLFVPHSGLLFTHLLFLYYVLHGFFHIFWVVI
jgi:hypothetical protein